MSNKMLVKLLKIIMLLGFSIFMFGHYLWLFANLPDKMGVTGIIIVAACCASGLILSLPTKIYLTMLLMQWEENAKQNRIDK